MSAMNRYHVALLLLIAIIAVLLFAIPAHAAGKPLAINFSPLAQTVAEGQKATFTLSKSGGNGRPALVRITTSDGSYTGSAYAGSTVTIPTADNSIVDGPRVTTVTATASTGAIAKATVNVLDNDIPVPDSSGTLAPLPPIADNFNTTDGLQPTAWGLPGSMGVDPVGAFRLVCGAGQLSYDDPIVYPGQPGKSHLHQFYGNLAADANSTFASLRTTGNSTCGDPNNPAAVNRSGYWMPAMLDGAGHVVKPMYVTIYYKRIPASDPRCTRSNPGSVGNCVGIPTGLRWITGYNMQGGTSDVQAFFLCQDSDDGTVKTLSSELKTNMTAVIPLCPIGARLTLNIRGPDCWDGRNLDSPDHRSHVAHASYVWDPNLIDPATGNRGLSYYRCDDAHPYHMPQVTIQAFYTVDANFAANKWHLVSDEMVPGAPPGTTFHADYWEAWSPTVRETWQTNCIDKHLNCAGGDLGNGTQIKGMTVPNTSGLVPMPTHP